jgi:Na+-translocating ferredoxin:NAD+ oxidoreductase subunit G
MSEQPNLIGLAISRNALILGLFAVATAAMLAFTNDRTRDQVACNRQQALAASLHEVLPPALADNNLLADQIIVTDATLGRGERHIYRARQAGVPSGAVLETVAPDGYGGAIALLVGVTVDGEITGVRVVPPHNETPGLGDKIETRKSDWMLGFNGRSLANTADDGWAVRKDGGDFDAFTGATITPRAVVGAVYRTLNYYRTHSATLFAMPAAAAGSLEHCHE